MVRTTITRVCHRPTLDSARTTLILQVYQKTYPSQQYVVGLVASTLDACGVVLGSIPACCLARLAFLRWQSGAWLYCRCFDTSTGQGWSVRTEAQLIPTKTYADVPIPGQFRGAPCPSRNRTPLAPKACLETPDPVSSYSLQGRRISEVKQAGALSKERVSVGIFSVFFI